MSASVPSMQAPRQRISGLLDHAPAVAVTIAAALTVTVLSPAVWLVLLQEGLLVVAVVFAAAGWGAWPVVALGFRGRSVSQQVCLSVALGLGLLGLMTLALGMAGQLHRVVAWVVVGAGWGLGVWRVLALRDTTPVGAARSHAVQASVFLLPLAVPLAIGALAACLPPGVLWNGEARGYDVLEYHLQVPREYFDAGRIQFLPHNVYASFPQQMEMLYLLLMDLAGGPLAAAIPAQFLHAACGVLAVVALGAWTPAGWPRRIVVLTAGCVPWVAYLGALAYVELGMLFFAAVAAGLLLEHFRRDPVDWRTALAAGLCAGLAGGCKYTAIVLVPLGLGAAWVLTWPVPKGMRVRRLLIFGAAAAAVVSPWLLRNAVFTGNPGYPFAYRWLGGAGWSPAQDAQWARGHTVPLERDSVAGRLRTAFDELPASWMFGPGIFVLAVGGLWAARSRAAAMLAAWAVLVVGGWALFTHMPGRFAVPVLVPLVLLSGVAAERRYLLMGAGVIAMAGALWNVAGLAREYREHATWYAAGGVPLGALVGATEMFGRVQPLRDLIGADGKVWLVGDARVFYLPARVQYTVVFSRDPWLEYARSATPAQAVAWLRTQQVARVVFSWPEIARLRHTYGFDEVVTQTWVEELVAAGLRRTLPTVGRGRDVEAYEVPAE